MKRTIGQVLGATEQVQEDRATEHALKGIQLKLDEINDCLAKLESTATAHANATAFTRCCGLLAQGQDVLEIESKLAALNGELAIDLEALVKATQLASYSNRSSGVLKESSARSFWDKHFHDQRACGIEELIEALKFESREWLADPANNGKAVNWDQVEPTIRAAFGCEDDDHSKQVTVLQFGELLGDTPLQETLVRLEARQVAPSHLVQLRVFRLPARKADPELDGLALLVRTTTSLSELRAAAVTFSEEAEEEEGEGSMPEFLLKGEFEFFLDDASTRVRRKQELSMSGTKYLSRAVIVPTKDLPKKSKKVSVSVRAGQKYAPVVPDDDEAAAEEDVSQPDIAARIMRQVEIERAMQLTIKSCIADAQLSLSLRKTAVELNGAQGEAAVDFMAKFLDLKNTSGSIKISGVKLRVVRAGAKALRLRYLKMNRFPAIASLEKKVVEAGQALLAEDLDGDEMLNILETVAEPLEELLAPCLAALQNETKHCGKSKSGGIIKAKKPNNGGPKKTKVVGEFIVILEGGAAQEHYMRAVSHGF